MSGLPKHITVWCSWFNQEAQNTVLDANLHVNLAGSAGDKSWSAVRRLHMARRVERSLLSYERSGWLEDTTVVTKHSEIRPSSEMGPIICCLDTSGSMHGARETVAKVENHLVIALRSYSSHLLA